MRSPKIKLYVLLAFILFGIFTTGLMYVRAIQYNCRKNGFNRKFLDHAFLLEATLPLNSNGYYISGMSSGLIYLGNQIAPDKLWFTDYSLKGLKEEGITGLEDAGKRRLRTIVDSPDIYLLDAGMSGVFHRAIFERNITRYQNKGVFFTQAQPLSPGSCLYRTLDRTEGKNILVKVRFDRDTMLRIPVLEKQVDGFYCTDGQLLYNKDHATAFYIYYYRNQFLALDTNVNLSYKGSTIDTNRHAKVEVVMTRINGVEGTTIASPILKINQLACTAGDHLLIHSALCADNEDTDTFYHHSVIDVYSIKDGRYRFSGYLPNIPYHTIKDMRLAGSRLAVLTDQYLRLYQFLPEGR